MAPWRSFCEPQLKLDEMKDLLRRGWLVCGSLCVSQAPLGRWVRDLLYNVNFKLSRNVSREGLLLELTKILNRVVGHDKVTLL